jgi:hypothetical protein
LAFSFLGASSSELAFLFRAPAVSRRESEPIMRRPDLVPDCGSCDALCCVATSFDACEDFAITKPAGTPCPHLATNHRCTIHASRLERGFLGCTIYDCYGAGPEVTRRSASDGSRQRQRDAAFMALRIVHELLWQLLEAAKLCPASQRSLAAELQDQIAELESLAHAPTSVLLVTAIEPHEVASRALLRRLGEALSGRPAKRLPIHPSHTPARAGPSNIQLRPRRCVLR